MRVPPVSSDVDGGAGVDEETHYVGLGRIGTACDKHPGGREVPMKQRHPLAVTHEPQPISTRRDHIRAALKRVHEGAAMGLPMSRILGDPRGVCLAVESPLWPKWPVRFKDTSGASGCVVTTARACPRLLPLCYVPRWLPWSARGSVSDFNCR